MVDEIVDNFDDRNKILMKLLTIFIFISLFLFKHDKIFRWFFIFIKSYITISFRKSIVFWKNSIMLRMMTQSFISNWFCCIFKYILPIYSFKMIFNQTSSNQIFKLLRNWIYIFFYWYLLMVKHIYQLCYWTLFKWTETKCHLICHNP